MLLARAILHLVLQERFRTEAQLFEDGAGAGLVEGHARHDFLDTGGHSDSEGLSGEEASDPGAASRRGHEDPQFCHVTRPLVVVSMQGAVTQELGRALA